MDGAKTPRRPPIALTLTVAIALLAVALAAVVLCRRRLGGIAAKRRTLVAGSVLTAR